MKVDCFSCIGRFQISFDHTGNDVRTKSVIMMREKFFPKKGEGLRSWGRTEGFKLASYRNKILQEKSIMSKAGYD
jgi:hypothetical protein